MKNEKLWTVRNAQMKTVQAPNEDANANEDGTMCLMKTLALIVEYN